MSSKTNKLRDLIRDLEYVFVRDLDPDRALDLVRALDRALDRIRALDRALDPIRDRDLARDRIRDLDRALAFARERALARGRARDRARALALAHDLDLALDLAHDLDRAGALSDQLRDLVQLVEVARQRAHQLAEACEESAAGVVRVRVSGAARWLVERAARVVPVSERARYGEEWRCELWELGQPARGRRRRQLAHALRLLSRAWGVRGGVRAARRRPAGG